MSRPTRSGPAARASPPRTPPARSRSSIACCAVGPGRMSVMCGVSRAISSNQSIGNVDARLVRDRRQMQHRVARPAQRVVDADGVAERRLGQDLPRPHVLAHQVHDPLADWRRRSAASPPRPPAPCRSPAATCPAPPSGRPSCSRCRAPGRSRCPGRRPSPAWSSCSSFSSPALRQPAAVVAVTVDDVPCRQPLRRLRLVGLAGLPEADPRRRRQVVRRYSAHSPAIIGPAVTTMVGMFTRAAAIIMPGRDLVAVRQQHQPVELVGLAPSTRPSRRSAPA